VVGLITASDHIRGTSDRIRVS